MDIMTLHRQFRRYCSLEEGLRPRTVAMFESCMKTFVTRTGITEATQLTLDVVQGFFYEGRERYQWSYWHYANHHKYLGKFMGWCVARGHLRENPIRKIRRPKKPGRLPRRLSHSQAVKLLHGSLVAEARYAFERVRNHAIVATLLYTGLRASELVGLTLLDLSLADGHLLVRGGKGGKDRFVPVHTKLRYILQRYLAERERLGRSSGSLFTSYGKDQGLSYRALGRVCRKLSRQTGIRFTAHCLRHTFGSVAIEEGMGLVQLKEIMGHQSVQSTMLYLQLSPRRLAQSVESLELF